MKLGFFDLVAAMKLRRLVVCVGHPDRTMRVRPQEPLLVNGIKPEDGSGTRWMITLVNSHTNVEVFWDEEWTTWEFDWHK